VIEFVCICGHNKVAHYEDWVEVLARFRGNCSTMRCYCMRFQMDNIKYLESLVD
jgi:hypothetical protein